MDRRRFLSALAGTSAAISFGGGFAGRVLAVAGTPGPDLRPNELPVGGTVYVPEGFSVRVVGKAFEPVGASPELWHPFPDGAACVARPDGGWTMVSNSEMQLPPGTGVVGTTAGTGGLPRTGGVTAMDFAADGTVLGARRLLDRTYVNCAGGLLPDGRWLSCEEWDGGLVWIVDPTGTADPVPVPAMGQYAHEAVGVEADGAGEIVHLYLTEDETGGLFYRYTPDGDLTEGVLEAMAVDGSGQVSWIAIDDPTVTALDFQDEWMGRFRDPADYPQGPPLRSRVPGAATFDGGEGCWYVDGHVYFTTKKDDRVWDLDVGAQRLTVLVGPAPGEPLLPEADRPINGVDNIIASGNGTLLVAQDHYDLAIVAVDPATGRTRAAARFEGDRHYRHPADPVLPSPLDSFEQSEITGLAFSPDGTRLYCNSQRYDGFGITYEIAGDWAGFSVV